MADKTTNLKLTLTNDTDATTTTFKQWRESINGETDSNMQKIDAFAGTTNATLTNKVDKETGKGLSTNDFTDADKAKVEAIPADPKYTDTTYIAGEGISISDTNVISATGGDVTAAGNNTFTGENTFKGLNSFATGVILVATPTSATPTSSLQATNKGYVDSNFLNKSDNKEQNVKGAVNFTSKVTVTAAPTTDNEVANKKYVDDHAATIGNVTATATSIDSSKPATVTATTSGNDISFAFGIPKGATGNSGVYLGTTTPTDPNVMVWVNPSGMTIEDGTEVVYG